MSSREARKSSRGGARTKPAKPVESMSDEDHAHVPVSTSDEDYTSVLTASGIKGKRKPAKAPKKRWKPLQDYSTVVSSTLRPDEGLDLLQLDDAGFDIQNPPAVVKPFIEHVKLGIKPRPKAPHDYTPTFEETRHVLDMPLFDPECRHWVLLVDQVELYSHRTADGTAEQAWRLMAKNERDPESPVVALFVLHTVVLPRKGLPGLPRR
jgi:hypothetical protein